MDILSNAERLERIKGYWKYRTSTNDHVDDVKWLIEQAERVEVLKSEKAFHESVMFGYEKQLSKQYDENARLKETLTFYADETRYQDYDEWSPGTSDVMSDHGRKAKSALEETK